MVFFSRGSKRSESGHSGEVPRLSGWLRRSEARQARTAGRQSVTTLLLAVLVPLAAMAEERIAENGFFTSGGAELYYETAGEGETILLLQGGPGYGSQLIAPLAGSLSDRYRTVIFDSRGTGRSTLAATTSDTVTLELMIADIEALRKHLGVERWTVLGYSWGGMYAMLYANQHRDAVRALVLCASGGVDLALLRDYERSVGKQMKNEFAHDGALHLASAYVFKPENVTKAAAHLSRHEFVTAVRDLVVADLFRTNYNLSQRFRTFDAPMLILQGEHDFVGRDTAENTRAAFPNAQSVLLPECGHLMALDQPEAFASALGAFLATNAKAAKTQWGLTAPGDTPEIFAPGVVSQEGRFEQNMTISPDGRELFFTVTDAGWTACRIVGLRFDGGWSPLEAPGVFNGDAYETEPRLSPDGRRMFFVSTRPNPRLDKNGAGTAIWSTERTLEGWAPPSKLSLLEQVWHPSVTRDGRLYFLSYAEGGYGEGDIYLSELEASEAPVVVNAGAVINSAVPDADPFISPDGNVLIFDSTREGGRGAWDLYVSFKQQDGSWSEPVNLGDGINTKHIEFGASLSPDGQYLFFSRRTADNLNGDVYWVSAAILDKLNPGLGATATGDVPNNRMDVEAHDVPDLGPSDTSADQIDLPADRRACSRISGIRREQARWPTRPSQPLDHDL